ncbi:phosphatase PAP2 family protein [Sphingomonas oryzagri]|jgi:hypothetical protein|uniref:Phosphatase PAP2 family protein n=1 Tax=Sphingomonas oryzagri TaxID=3042314 RepID=A0ABT6MXW2_9SPHN|nr:phosphatase PAP2 family protein [Sphingomonas oryzagri]MDH7637652.1 phosphatase PAP2 family protein [Sphingomonas oryzagri]
MSGSRVHRHQVELRSKVPFLPTRWLILIVTISALMDGVLLHAAGLSIAETPTALGFGVWALAAAFFCIHFRMPATERQRIARDFIEGLSLFALISLLGAIASYPLAAGHHALVDPELERVDLTLHFHWVSLYEWIAGHSWAQMPERVAYLSIFATPAVLIGYFAWTERRAESRAFLATFWVAAVMTLSLFPLFPAAGPFSSLWRGAAPYMPLSALYQDQVILALRQHAIHQIDLGELHGLVCAPSFHAASAVIYIATALRVRSLRWPLVALNILMLMATPVEGTHYLADLLAGGIVAVTALWLTPVLIKMAEGASFSWFLRIRELQPVAAE